VIWLGAPAIAAGLYYLLAIVGALRWKANPRPTQTRMSVPLSLLKPVHGRDPRFYVAIRSHAVQDYPEFEILFGVSDPGDPALPDIERLQREFPERRIEIVVAPTKAPNAKAGVLAELARRARHSLLVVNDSDIVVEPGYLRAVAAPLEDERIGLVTCLYRAEAESWPSRAESLSIATEFAPSVLMARLVGQAEFALGSTLALRAEVLGEIGGFEAITDYLADDYQLGRRITERGYRIALAPVVVATDFGAETWLDSWRHQVRWSRTIRTSRPKGYYGYIITQATIWALVAFAARQWWAGAAALAVRVAAGVLVGARVLRDRHVARNFWAIPLRDLFGFAVWLGGGFGRTVYWRDRKLRLLEGGRIGRITELDARTASR
jgi:ceramide glucosyltransferase